MVAKKNVGARSTDDYNKEKGMEKSKYNSTSPFLSQTWSDKPTQRPQRAVFL
jgi:hypothetical protein